MGFLEVNDQVWVLERGKICVLFCW